MAAEARAVAEGNARAGPVFISGAAGMNSAAINGFYTVTEEKSSDGRVVLSKRGDASMCIEHLAGKWQVKDVSGKGTSAGMAFVEGGCALEDCTSRVWWVHDGIPENPHVEQPSVKMSTGNEAERRSQLVGSRMLPSSRGCPQGHLLSLQDIRPSNGKSVYNPPSYKSGWWCDICKVPFADKTPNVLHCTYFVTSSAILSLIPCLILLQAPCAILTRVLCAKSNKLFG